MIRSALTLVLGVTLTFSLSAWVRVSGLFRAPWTRSHCSLCSRMWGRALLWVAGAKVHIEGAEGGKLDQPLVVVANHQSWFDVFALAGTLPARTRFVAKEELRRVPLFGAAWEMCGHIRVNRGDRAEAVRSLDEAGHRIRDERLNVIVFAEGTRSRDGRLMPFKKGAFMLALQTGVPILPIGISGSRGVMAKGSFRIRPGEIRIRLGEPISVEGLTLADRDALLQRTRNEVLSLMEDPDGVPALQLPGLDGAPSGSDAPSPPLRAATDEKGTDPT